MTRDELLKMIDKADECRIGLDGKNRYISLVVSKELLREKAEDLVFAGVRAEFSEVTPGTLYVESVVRVGI